MDAFESQHCTAFGLERCVLYSEPIARGYELRYLHCQNCKTVLRMVCKRLPEKKAGLRGSWRSTATICGLPLSMRNTNLARLLARRPDGIFVAPFEQGEIGPDLFRKREFGLEGLGRPVEALG
jgi:hypothetical protein